MPTFASANLTAAIPEIFLAGVAMTLLMFGAFQRDGRPEAVRTTRIVANLSALALVLAVFLVVRVGTGPAIAFGGMFIVDGFAAFAKVAILLTSALSILMSIDYLERHGAARFEFPVIVLLATVGMMMMVAANDLIALYLGLELLSLAAYVLAAFLRDDARSSEAGLKYFVLGALASGMLLYGSSLIYGYAGGTGFSLLADQFLGRAPGLGVVVGLVFLLAGLAFKVSAVPFHMWTPDVYEGAPTPVVAFFSVAPKVAAIALLVRAMIGPFGPLFDQWQQIVFFLSVASMALGAFAALNQNNIKRLMAYSSIGHVGYALIGLCVGTVSGVEAVLVYLGIYVVMNLGVFACILGMRRTDRMVEQISDLAGLNRSHPGMALALALLMFSMAGIPPLAGFFGKFYVFMAAIEAELYWLAVVGVLTSVVAAYYYLRIVRVMYFDPLTDPLDKPLGRVIGLVMAGSTVMVGLFFVIPTPLIAAARAAAASLFPG